MTLTATQMKIFENIDAAISAIVRDDESISVHLNIIALNQDNVPEHTRTFGHNVNSSVVAWCHASYTLRAIREMFELNGDAKAIAILDTTINALQLMTGIHIGAVSSQAPTVQ